MRVILIEDNPQVREYVKSLLIQYPGVKVVGEAEGLEDGYLLLTQTPADLWILDIELRDGNVFALLEKIDAKLMEEVRMVFLTAFGTFDYVVQALRQSAVDYLLKPVDPEQFKETIVKMQQAVPLRNLHHRIDELREIIAMSSAKPVLLEKLPLTLSKGVIHYIDLNNILYLEGVKEITYVQTLEGKKIATMHHLGHYRDSLAQNEAFIQVAKHYIVNTRFIEYFTPGDSSIKFKNGMSIITSRRGGQSLMAFFRSMFK